MDNTDFKASYIYTQFSQLTFTILVAYISYVNVQLYIENKLNANWINDKQRRQKYIHSSNHKG